MLKVCKEETLGTWTMKEEGVGGVPRSCGLVYAQRERVSRAGRVNRPFLYYSRQLNVQTHSLNRVQTPPSHSHSTQAH